VNLADWSDLFVAAAGASAALAGLIIVAMSVNIETIVKYPSLPSRAGATIAVLVLVTVVSILALVPDLALGWLGWAIVVVALICLGFAIESTVRMVRESGLVGFIKAAVLIVPTLGFVIGGAILAAGDVAGLYFVAAGMVLAFVGTVLNAWVLLVEIRR
jgi:hypothetical protein